MGKRGAKKAKKACVMVTSPIYPIRNPSIVQTPGGAYTQGRRADTLLSADEAKIVEF